MVHNERNADDRGLIGVLKQTASETRNAKEVFVWLESRMARGIKRTSVQTADSEWLSTFSIDGNDAEQVVSQSNQMRHLLRQGTAFVVTRSNVKIVLRGLPYPSPILPLNARDNAFQQCNRKSLALLRDLITEEPRVALDLVKRPHGTPVNIAYNVEKREWVVGTVAFVRSYRLSNSEINLDLVEYCRGKKKPSHRGDDTSCLTAIVWSAMLKQRSPEHQKLLRQILAVGTLCGTLVSVLDPAIAYDSVIPFDAPSPELFFNSLVFHGFSCHDGTYSLLGESVQLTEIFKGLGLSLAEPASLAELKPAINSEALLPAMIAQLETTPPKCIMEELCALKTRVSSTQGVIAKHTAELLIGVRTCDPTGEAVLDDVPCSKTAARKAVQAVERGPTLFLATVHSPTALIQQAMEAVLQVILDGFDPEIKKAFQEHRTEQAVAEIIQARTAKVVEYHFDLLERTLEWAANEELKAEWLQAGRELLLRLASSVAKSQSHSGYKKLVTVSRRCLLDGLDLLLKGSTTTTKRGLSTPDNRPAKKTATAKQGVKAKHFQHIPLLVAESHSPDRANAKPSAESPAASTSLSPFMKHQKEFPLDGEWGVVQQSLIEKMRISRTLDTMDAPSPPHKKGADDSSSDDNATADQTRENVIDVSSKTVPQNNATGNSQQEPQSEVVQVEDTDAKEADADVSMEVLSAVSEHSSEAQETGNEVSNQATTTPDQSTTPIQAEALAPETSIEDASPLCDTQESVSPKYLLPADPTPDYRPSSAPPALLAVNQGPCSESLVREALVSLSKQSERLLSSSEGAYQTKNAKRQRNRLRKQVRDTLDAMQVRGELRESNTESLTNVMLALASLRETQAHMVETMKTAASQQTSATESVDTTQTEVVQTEAIHAERADPSETEPIDVDAVMESDMQTAAFEGLPPLVQAAEEDPQEPLAGDDGAQSTPMTVDNDNGTPIVAEEGVILAVNSDTQTFDTSAPESASPASSDTQHIEHRVGIDVEMAEEENLKPQTPEAVAETSPASESHAQAASDRAQEQQPLNRLVLDLFADEIKPMSEAATVSIDGGAKQDSARVGQPEAMTFGQSEDELSPETPNGEEAVTDKAIAEGMAPEQTVSEEIVAKAISEKAENQAAANEELVASSAMTAVDESTTATDGPAAPTDEVCVVDEAGGVEQSTEPERTTESQPADLESSAVVEESTAAEVEADEAVAIDEEPSVVVQMSETVARVTEAKEASALPVDPADVTDASVARIETRKSSVVVEEEPVLNATRTSVVVQERLNIREQQMSTISHEPSAGAVEVEVVKNSAVGECPAAEASTLVIPIPDLAGLFPQLAADESEETPKHSSASDKIAEEPSSAALSDRSCDVQVLVEIEDAHSAEIEDAQSACVSTAEEVLTVLVSAEPSVSDEPEEVTPAYMRVEDDANIESPESHAQSLGSNTQTTQTSNDDEPLVRRMLSDEPLKAFSVSDNIAPSVSVDGRRLLKRARVIVDDEEDEIISPTSTCDTMALELVSSDGEECVTIPDTLLKSIDTDRLMAELVSRGYSVRRKANRRQVQEAVVDVDLSTPRKLRRGAHGGAVPKKRLALEPVDEAIRKQIWERMQRKLSACRAPLPLFLVDGGDESNKLVLQAIETANNSTSPSRRGGHFTVIVAPQSALRGTVRPR